MVVYVGGPGVRWESLTHRHRRGGGLAAPSKPRRERAVRRLMELFGMVLTLLPGFGVFVVGLVGSMRQAEYLMDAFGGQWQGVSF